MQLTQDDRRVLSAIDDAGPALIDRTIAWCAINSGSRHLTGRERQREALEPAMAALPGTLERLPLSPSVEVTADGRESEQPHPDALQGTGRDERLAAAAHRLGGVAH